MSKKANPTLIGGFVLGAIVLLVGVLLVVTGGRVFRDTRSVVSYFQGSVRGLQIGSIVVFQGVPIGKVTDIRLVVDTQSVELSIPVVMQIDRSLLDFTGAPGSHEKFIERLDALKKKGLRAQMVVDSLVTGQVLIEFGFHPGTAEVYRAPPGTDMPEMPTVPSDLQVVMEKVEDLVATIETLPIEQVVTALANSLEGLDQLLNSEKLARIVDGLDQLVNSEETQQLASSLQSSLTKLDSTLDDASQLLQNVDGQVEPLVANLNSTLAEVDLVLADARGLLAGLSQMASTDSELYFNANATLRELENAMRALRGFVDFLDRNPEALLRGRRQP